MADLYSAAERGQIADVKRLLEARADVAYKTDEVSVCVVSVCLGSIVLGPVYTGGTDLTADFSIYLQFEYTPLRAASAHGHTEM